MKTKGLTLTSHYFGIELKLRISEAAAKRIEEYAEPMDLINEAITGFDNGSPRLFSDYQSRKIRNFFTADNKEYFDKISIE